MPSGKIPQLHVDKELKVTTLILIHVDADMMSHTDLGQKTSKNSSTETHRVPMGLVSFKKEGISHCTLEESVKTTFYDRPIILRESIVASSAHNSQQGLISQKTLVALTASLLQLEPTSF